VRAELGHVLDGTPTACPTARGLGRDRRPRRRDLGRFLVARQAIVTSLAAEVRAGGRGGGRSRFVVMDMAGAAKGYASGEPTGAPAPAGAWREGLDPAAVAGRRTA
jgi:hypothetical protein